MNPTAALNAYTSAAKLISGAEKSAQGAAPIKDGAEFANVLKSTLENVQATGQAAETKATDLASGRADMVDVVTAVAETELAVESMVAVRDRVISAYQELMNMPI